MTTSSRQEFQDKTESVRPPVRRAYVRPTLISLGTVASLTCGNQGSQSDNFTTKTSVQ